MALRHQAEAARERSRAAYYGSAAAVQTAERMLAVPEPTGIWARILGRHAEWVRQRDEAQELLSSLHRAHSDAGDEADRLARRLAPLERHYADEVRRAEERHLSDRRQARSELENISGAQRILAEDPRLARFGADRLAAEARRRMDLEHRERTHRPDPEQASTASYGPRR